MNKRHKANREARSYASDFVTTHAQRLKLQRILADRGFDIEEQFGPWNDKTSTITHLGTGVEFHQSWDEAKVDAALKIRS